MARQRIHVLVAAALCAVTLLLGICTGFVSAQESSTPATTVASSPFTADTQFGQILQDSPEQSTPEQWVRGRLSSSITIPECPRYWHILDRDGMKFFDSDFGTWGSPWGSDALLRAYSGQIVEVRLLKDMHCMNTPPGEFTWRLASLEPLGTAQATWRVHLPILMRNHEIVKPSTERYAGRVAILADGEPQMDYRLFSACNVFIGHIEGANLSWNGKWVTFNATRSTRSGENWLTWDGNVNTLSMTDNRPPCPWTPTFTPTPQLHNDIIGVVERADPRECAHAYIRSCNGLGRIGVRHPDGPAFFEAWIGRGVQTGGYFSTSCTGVTEIGGLSPFNCSTIVSPTPTPTRGPNFTEGYIIIRNNGCGNAEMWTACWTRVIGWVSNAPRSWNNKWVQFYRNDFGICPNDPSQFWVTWDGDTSTVNVANSGPTCGTETPTPSATSPVSTATHTRTPTPVSTTPVPPTVIWTPPPTNTPTPVNPGPGQFTATLLTVWQDDGWGTCGTVLAITCAGEIFKVQNAPADFGQGTAYTFVATLAGTCTHEEHNHPVVTVGSALTPTTCPAGSVDIPAWRPCEGPLCWRYKVTEMNGLPPLVLLLPYPRPLSLALHGDRQPIPE